jgi:hypothetical protein
LTSMIFFIVFLEEHVAAPEFTLDHV